MHKTFKYYIKCGGKVRERMRVNKNSCTQFGRGRGRAAWGRNGQLHYLDSEGPHMSLKGLFMIFSTQLVSSCLVDVDSPLQMHQEHVKSLQGMASTRIALSDSSLDMAYDGDHKSFGTKMNSNLTTFVLCG